MQRFPLTYWLLSVGILFYLFTPKPSAAQIVPDATLPNNSIVPPNCTNCEITGDTTVGNNLFHSFQQFSIPTGGTAYFNNALTVENIISRVTGKDVDPNQGLVQLPAEPVNMEVAQGCQASGKQASVEFFNIGRGGLAPNPYEPLSSSYIWQDVPRATRGIDGGTQERGGNTATQVDKIVEAQGWIVDEKGEVTLVAQMLSNRSQGRCSLR